MNRPSRTKTLTGAVIAIAALALLGPWAVTTVAATDRHTDAPRTGTSAASASPGTGPVPVLRPRVLREIPHDRAAFTQGFEIAGDILYEGTGLYGRSQLRELDPVTGKVLRAVPLPGQLFGEGITVVGDRIWQLTYQDGVVLEWDRSALTLVRQLPLAGQGWGLCHDGARLIRSDGTDLLRFHDPTTFAAAGTVRVTRDGRPVTRLNELECVGGHVLANVWRTDEIYRIDPVSGRVTAVIDARGLLDDPTLGDEDVLNGIAALPGDEFLIPGKRWPTTFRVSFTPASAAPGTP